MRAVRRDREIVFQDSYARRNPLMLVYEHIAELFFFFFQAEDGIRDLTVTGVQTCALPIFQQYEQFMQQGDSAAAGKNYQAAMSAYQNAANIKGDGPGDPNGKLSSVRKIGRASCRERV